MMRTMLVDDHAAFREPVAFMIDQEPDMTVIAQAESLAEGREVLSRVGGSVDLAIIDLDLPDGNGIDLIDDLHAANRDALALVLSAYSEQERTAEAVAAGAAGVLHKSARVGEVIEAARRLGAGEQLLSATEIAQLSRLAYRQRREDDRARAMIGRLTPRELDVLQALAEGLSDKDIAKRLYIGAGTVRFHMVNILTKLEAASRLQALVFAVRHDLVKI